MEKKIFVLFSYRLLFVDSPSVANLIKYGTYKADMKVFIITKCKVEFFIVTVQSKLYAHYFTIPTHPPTPKKPPKYKRITLQFSERTIFCCGEIIIKKFAFIVNQLVIFSQQTKNGLLIFILHILYIQCYFITFSGNFYFLQSVSKRSTFDFIS